MRIVAFAYACEPGKGSEPGAGWAMAQLLAGSAETHVITRANNRDAIEAALPSLPPERRPNFVYVDPPRALTRWKRGTRGVRLFYLWWLKVALARAREMHFDRPFDVAWHLTLANAWLGTTAGRLPIPLVYGPVGGGVSPPWRLVTSLGPKGVLYEIVRAGVRMAGRYLNPLSRAAWKKADLILVQNPETRDWFPAAVRDRCEVFQHALIDDATLSEPGSARLGGTAIYVGRLIPWKGVSLAIRAVARVPDQRLTIVGDGPDRERLEELVRTLDVEDRVRFMGSVSRDVALEELSRSEVLLFPSLHDDSPLAVGEAAWSGLPVICLARGGAPIVADGAAIPVSPWGGTGQVVARLADALGAPERWPEDWDRERLLVQRRTHDLRAVLGKHGLIRD